MTTVLAFGTYDCFHKGHEYFLSQAKKHGDMLIVVIARDENVLKFKKIIPRDSETTRLKQVSAFDAVDKAVLGSKTDIYAVLEEYKPDVICLGYDQHSRNLQTELKKRNMTPQIVHIASHKPDVFKSSKIRINNS